jgi:hypothetical protein
MEESMPGKAEGGAETGCGKALSDEICHVTRIVE